MDSPTQANCSDCARRFERPLCDLPAETLRALDQVKSLTLFPRGATLLREGQTPRAAFILCQGRARLTLCSEIGRRLTLRIAGPGEVLGLSASLSGSPYELTAELLDDAQVAVIKRKDLLRFLRDHREACLQVVSLLSQDLHVAYDRVRSLGLGRTRRSRAPRVN